MRTQEQLSPAATLVDVIEAITVGLSRLHAIEDTARKFHHALPDGHRDQDAAYDAYQVARHRSAGAEYLSDLARVAVGPWTDPQLEETDADGEAPARWLYVTSAERSASPAVALDMVQDDPEL